MTEDIIIDIMREKSCIAKEENQEGFFETLLDTVRIVGQQLLIGGIADVIFAKMYESTQIIFNVLS